MHFLAINEIWLWCEERDIPLVDSARPAAQPRLAHTARHRYASGGRTGREDEVARAAVRALGDWDECLLWVTLVGVWPSTEDWPAYYAMRGTRGERRSIEVAPGHEFGVGERKELVDFLRVVLESGWDAYVLPAREGRAADVRLVISHDEWFEIQAVAPVEFAMP